MPDPVLWSIDDHTRAKHRVLASYVAAWIPVMGMQSLKIAHLGRQPHLLIVDGFAGPGRYAGGEPGSPLIMLHALTTHAALDRLARVKFSYLFIEQDPRRVSHLRTEIEGLALPSNVQVMVEEGAFEEVFGDLVNTVQGASGSLIPTFAFIDPFGYSNSSMSLAGRFLDFPRSEALFFLPLSFIHRFVGREGQEQALDGLFGTDSWREAIPLDADERRQFLLRLFETQLLAQSGVEHVTSFQLRTRDGNDYRLVFATGHERGLELMKRSMWTVDPVQGISYSASTDSGQSVLFTPTVDTTPLLKELRSVFGNRSFTVEEASRVTLLRTPFIPSSHLKTLTLAPAERSGELIVQRPASRRSGTFTPDVRMQFARDAVDATEKRT
jgi:three-Cys-motif partner protein